MTNKQPESTHAVVPTIAPIPRRRRRWPLIIGGLFALLIIFSGVGFVTASTLEDHDSFCIACHTIPETTYYNRAYIELDNPDLTITDLATYHYHISPEKRRLPFACIDCHRGDSGLGDRIAAITLGARDSVTFVTGHENSTLEKTQTNEGWLSNAACVSCHTDTLLDVKGLPNHFHTKLPQVAALLAAGKQSTIDATFTGTADSAKDWITAVTNVPLTCTSCHVAHSTLANGMSSKFVDNARRIEACISCHKVAKQGPQDAADLGG